MFLPAGQAAGCRCVAGVAAGSMWTQEKQRGLRWSWICMVWTWGLERDGLTLQHPWVSCHHVASNLLLQRRNSLQYHGGGRWVVYSGIVAGVWSCSPTLTRLLLCQSHVTELGVEGVRL